MSRFHTLGPKHGQSIARAAAALLTVATLVSLSIGSSHVALGQPRSWTNTVTGRVAARGVIHRNASGAVVPHGQGVPRFIEYDAAGTAIGPAPVRITNGSFPYNTEANGTRVRLMSARDYNSRVTSFRNARTHYETIHGQGSTVVHTRTAYEARRCAGPNGETTPPPLAPRARWAMAPKPQGQTLFACSTFLIAQSLLPAPETYVGGNANVAMSLFVDDDWNVVSRSRENHYFRLETGVFQPPEPVSCSADRFGCRCAEQETDGPRFANGNAFLRCHPSRQRVVYAPVAGAEIDVALSGPPVLSDAMGLFRFPVRGITVDPYNRTISAPSPMGTITQSHGYVQAYSDYFEFAPTATIRFGSFNPRNPSSRMVQLTSRVVVGDPEERTLENPFVNFIVDVAMVRVVGALLDEQGRPLPLVDPDYEGDGVTEHSFVEHVAGQPSRSQGLVTQVSAADLTDTDLYVFRASDGMLVGERRGAARGQDVAGVPGSGSDDADMLGYAFLDFTAMMRGTHTRSERTGQRVLFPAATVTQAQLEGEGGGLLRNEVRYGIELEYPDPGTPYFNPVEEGDVLDLVLVNRATGYLGRERGIATFAATGELAIVPSDDTSGYPGHGDAIYIPMHPPNLRVRARRTTEGANGADRRAVVGFEGAGLSSDKLVEITTEWLDPYGRALPESLPGFTGRLARIVDGTLVRVGTGAGDEARTGLFPIEPGFHVQVVRLTEASERARYYVHVDGTPSSRLPDFDPAEGSPEQVFSTHEVCHVWRDAEGTHRTCFGRPPTGTPLDDRPVSFVPVKVEVFDGPATRDAFANTARALAEAYEPGDPVPVMPSVAPIYAFIYNPEFQFSIYDLDLEAARVETRYTPQRGSRTDVSIDYDLAEGDDPLTGFTGDRSLLFGVGYAALVALAGQHQTINSGSVNGFPSLEELLSVTPARRAEILGELLGTLTPADFLSLQVYQQNDPGNVLVDVHGLPLVLANVRPFHLERRHQIQQFEGGIPSGPGYVDDYEPFTFTVLRDARVTVRLERADGFALATLADATLPPGRHHFVLDAGRGLAAGVTPTTPGVQIVLEATPIDPPRNGTALSHKVVWPGTIAERHNNLTVGQTMVHDVLLQDGSLRLSRTDFQVAGLGPVHAWGRSYTNLGTSADDSPLGPGWGHTYDLRAYGLTTDEMLSDSVPAWVRMQDGRFFTADAVPQMRPTWTGIAVNGTTFRKWNGQWWPERGRHGLLDEDPETGELVFTSMDGTKYYYDAPQIPSVGQLVGDAARDRISITDGLASRIGVDPDVLNLPGVGSPSPGFTLPNRVMGAGVPTRAKRIEDRNGNAMSFAYDERERLASVTDAVARTTTLTYGVVHGFDRLTAVSGPGGIAISYGYDERGYLTSATRAERVERYTYAPETGVVGGDYNLTSFIVTPDGQEELATVYTYGTEQTVGAGLATFLRHVRSTDVVTSVLMPSRSGEVPREPRISFAYPANGGANTRTITNANGHDTTYTLNANANPVRIDEPLGRVTHMRWSADEPNGRDNVLVGQDDPLRAGVWRTTTWAREYDARGRVTQVTMTDARGKSAITTFDPRWGVPLTVRDRNLVETSSTYDEHGNVLTHTDGDDHVHTYTYYPNGLVQTSREPGNAIATTYTYDEYGLPNVVRAPEGSETDSDYDVRGRIRRIVDPRGNEISFEYDALDRATAMTVPHVTLPPARGEALASVSQRTTVTRTYDAIGHLLSETNLNGLTTTRTYTARGQVKTTDFSEGDGIIHFRYDTEGALLGQTDRKGVWTTFTYDALGRRETTTNRLGDIASVAYDLGGRVTRVTDFAGNVSTMGYDVLDRLEWREVEGTNGSRVDLTYYDEADASSNLKSTTVARAPFPDATTTYVYDGRYHLTERTDNAQQTHRWTYDASGDLTREEDEGGRVTRREFDRQHRLRFTHLDSDGGTITTETRYDAAGNVIARIDPEQRRVEFTYDEWQRPYIRRDQYTRPHYILFDALGNPVNVRDRLGHDVTTLRDAFGRVRRALDQNGSAITTHYDANGNVERVHDLGLGRVVTIDYDAEDRSTIVMEGVGTDEVRSTAVLRRDGMGNPELVRDYNGNVTETAYDVEYRPWRITDALGEVSQIAYGKSGLVSSVTDRRGHSTHFEYDELGRQTVVRNALNEETVRTYDAVGHVRTVTDGREIVTVFAYDDFDRLVEITRAGQRVAFYEYDTLGNVRFRTDGKNHRTETQYDDLNRPVRTIHPDGTTTRVQYDHEGRVVRAENEESEATRFDYDPAGRLLRRVLLGEDDAELEVTSFTYDSAGKVLTRTDPEGQAGGLHAGFSRSFTYDVHSRLERVTEGSLSTTYEYDANGNMRHVRLPPNAHVELTYDALNRRTALIQHRATGNLSWTYPDYDEEGNVLTAVDPNGQSTTTTYDELGRPDHVTFPAPAGRAPARGWLAEVTYGYDANGNPETITQTRAGNTGGSATETISRVYDAFDRVDTETDRALTIDYAYDANGNRTGVSSPAGATTYRYDARNRLDRVTIGSEHTEYTYFDDGMPETITRPNGAVTTFTPEPYTNRISSIEHATPQGAFARVGYTYDKNGNPLTEAQTISGQTETTTFDYDALDRMLSHSRVTAGQPGGVSATYTFEGYDRKTETLTDAGGAITERTYFYDDSRRLERVDVAQQGTATRTVTYGYDANGNTTARTDSAAPNDRTTYVYDGADHLTDVIRGAPGAEQVLGSFEYDAGGRRIRHHQSDRGNVETYFDGASVLEEHEMTTDALLAHYRYADSLLAVDTPAEGRQWYHHDGRSSTMALTGAVGGNVEATYRLDPFGAIRSQTGTTANRRVFTGHEHDANTGLVNMGARFYDPETARFITQDSYLGEGTTPPSLHRYLYAYSNPGRYVDPDGHQAVCWSDYCPPSGATSGVLGAAFEAPLEMPIIPTLPLGKDLQRAHSWWEESRDGIEREGIRLRTKYQDMAAVYASLDASLSSYTGLNPDASTVRYNQRLAQHRNDAEHVGYARWMASTAADILDTIGFAGDVGAAFTGSAPAIVRLEAWATESAQELLQSLLAVRNAAWEAGYMRGRGAYVATAPLSVLDWLHTDDMASFVVDSLVARVKAWWRDYQNDRAEAIGDFAEFKAEMALQASMAVVGGAVEELVAVRAAARVYHGATELISQGSRGLRSSRRAGAALEDFAPGPAARDILTDSQVLVRTWNGDLGALDFMRRTRGRVAVAPETIREMIEGGRTEEALAAFLERFDVSIVDGATPEEAMQVFIARGSDSPAGPNDDDYIVAAALRDRMRFAVSDRRAMRAAILSGVQDVRWTAPVSDSGIRVRYWRMFRTLEGLQQERRLSRPIEEHFDFVNPF